MKTKEVKQKVKTEKGRTQKHEGKTTKQTTGKAEPEKEPGN